MKRKAIHKLLLVLCFGLMVIFPCTPVIAAHVQAKQAPQNEIASTVEQGFKYIATQMNADGGIRWVDDTSSIATTLRVVWALAAGGYAQDYLRHESGKRPIDFLASDSAGWVNQVDSDAPGFNVARAGQLLTAIAAANENPNNFSENSINYIHQIISFFDPGTGTFGNATPENVLDQVWAIIGLAANNASVPLQSVEWLRSAQLEDGSWNDGYGNFLDTTPLAILAIISSEHLALDTPEIRLAMDYLQDKQQSDGGWQTIWDSNTNASTTAMIAQAIFASGHTPTNVNWKKENGNPHSALLALVQENGAIGGDFTNAYSTADAIVGLSGKWITRLGYVQNASEAFDFLLSKQESSGGWGSVGQTIDVLLALHAGGWQPNTLVAADSTPLDFITENIEPFLESGPDAIGKAIIGLIAIGENPLEYNGIDLTQRLMTNYDETLNAFGSSDNTWHQAFAILGLYAAGADIPEGAVKNLINLQQANGGWEYSPGLGTWPDNTAIAIQALLGSGYSIDSTEIQRGKDYIKSMQWVSGGWGDASTTAYVITALNALGESFEYWVTETGKMPLADLFYFQKPNGAFVYSWAYPEDNLMATTSALLAIYKGDFIIHREDFPQNNFAAVFVDPGEGKIHSACVEFTEETISAFELLDSSGFSYESKDGFINQILNLSNKEGETNYWSFWHWDGREWEFYNSGIGETRIYPGAIQAWYFTSWEKFPSLPPDFIPNIDHVCPENVLVNYEDQPHIDFNDLFLDPFDENKFSEPIIMRLQEEALQSPLPISYLIAAGSIISVAIIVLLLKKRT